MHFIFQRQKYSYQLIPKLILVWNSSQGKSALALTQYLSIPALFLSLLLQITQLTEFQEVRKKPKPKKTQPKPEVSPFQNT